MERKHLSQLEQVLGDNPYFMGDGAYDIELRPI